MLFHEFSLIGSARAAEIHAEPDPGSWSKPILMMAIAASMVAAGSSHARQTHANCAPIA
jgi:hypothetical protein